MRQKILLRELGLRDGLQIQTTFMAPAAKLAWAAAEAATGIAEITNKRP